MLPAKTESQKQSRKIVDKLHSALSTLRKERDELHRSKELAAERLRLAKEERMGAERNLALLKGKYDHIVSPSFTGNDKVAGSGYGSGSNGGNKAEIEKLQSEVEMLGREVCQSWVIINKTTIAILING